MSTSVSPLRFRAKASNVSVPRTRPHHHRPAALATDKLSGQGGCNSTNARYEQMPTLLHFADSRLLGHGASVRLDSGEPCTVSIASNGARVKKSRWSALGGGLLYKDDSIEQAAATAKALGVLFKDDLFPLRFRNTKGEQSHYSPVLSLFTNAILHCSTCSEVASTLNEAIERAEKKTGRSVRDIDWAELEIASVNPPKTIWD